MAPDGFSFLFAFNTSFFKIFVRLSFMSFMFDSPLVGVDLHYRRVYKGKRSGNWTSNSSTLTSISGLSLLADFSSTPKAS